MLSVAYKIVTSDLSNYPHIQMNYADTFILAFLYCDKFKDYNFM